MNFVGQEGRPGFDEEEDWVRRTLAATFPEQPPLVMTARPAHARVPRYALAGAASLTVLLITMSVFWTAHHLSSRSRAAGTHRTSGFSESSQVPTAQYRLTPRLRAIALAAAHRAAKQLAIGSERKPTTWPTNIDVVAARSARSQVLESNTGYTCRSGGLVYVFLYGTFNIAHGGTARLPPTAKLTAAPPSSVTFQRVDLTVDARTGVTCLLSYTPNSAKPNPMGIDIVYSR